MSEKKGEWGERKRGKGGELCPTRNRGMAAPLARTISLLAANRPNLQNGLSSASSVASYTLRLWDARSFFIVANQEV